MNGYYWKQFIQPCGFLFFFLFPIFVGETDWKVLAIDVSDPLADKINGKYCSFSSKLACRKECAL